MAYTGRQQTQTGKIGPMKGVFAFMNEDTMKLIQEAFSDIALFYTDKAHENDPGLVLEGLLNPGTAAGDPVLKRTWQYEEDKFGHKAFTSVPYAVNGHEEGELRVTVVLKNESELHFDVRIWGPYNQDRPQQNRFQGRRFSR